MACAINNNTSYQNLKKTFSKQAIYNWVNWFSLINKKVPFCRPNETHSESLYDLINDFVAKLIIIKTKICLHKILPLKLLRYLPLWENKPSKW